MSRTLTPKTNLETLRKDAKRWLRALRAGDARARTRLAAVWPAAPSEPVLRDLQQALAREYGCKDWIALKAAVDDLALARKSQAERVALVLDHAWIGDPVAARRILARYPAVAQDSLFAAAVCGDLAEVERRLARDPGAAIKTGAPRDWTALAYAAYSRLDPVNGLAIARRLLEAGADPNFQFDDGWGSPFKVLTGAIRLGEGARPSHPQAEALVDLLVAAGADPFDRQALYNISIVGADLYWYEVLWRHCEAKGDLDRWRDVAQGWLGNSMLDYLLGNAVGQNHLDRARWLLERGADPDANHAYTHRPVHALAQVSGYLRLAELLEGHGGQPARLEGADAFRAAVLRHDEASARAQAAAAPELVRDPAPLLAAAEFGDDAAVAILLSLGADPRGLDREGISPLHRAVQSGSAAAVDRLLAAGADVDLRENRWRGTPLSWAAVLGRPHLFARLVPLSHDVRALSSLAAFERLEAVLAADPALANDRLAEPDAPTPLFCLPDDEAAAVKAVQILLAHGADASILDDAGRSAADAANARSLDEAADLLETRTFQRKPRNRP